MAIQAFCLRVVSVEIVMMNRLLRLALGMWSPSAVMTIQCRDFGVAIEDGLLDRAPSPPSKLGILDRWELWNHARDVRRLGRDPMLPSPELAAGLELGARMMRGEYEDEDADEPPRAP